MARKNFPFSNVATAPSPADSGTSLVVSAGHGARFPSTPFKAVICPVGARPISTNAEVINVTNVSTDTFTIQRAQESSSARTVEVGDDIFAIESAATLDALDTAIAARLPFTTNGSNREIYIDYLGGLDDANVDFDVNGDFLGTLKKSGNSVYYATGPVVPVTDGGTGSSTAAAAALALSVLPSDGWINANETWTYASGAGTNVGTFTIAGVDLTGKYQPGMRVKFTQTTVKYAIITKVAFSTDTTVTIYMGTDYTIANAAISVNYYSIAKAPFGFPLDPNKWEVKLIDTTTRSQSSPTQNVWYNLGSLSITLPIGIWNVRYDVMLGGWKTTSTAVDFQSTLSTANNSESDNEMTAGVTQEGASGTQGPRNHVGKSKTIVTTSSTTYYLNCRCSTASGSSIQILNGTASLVIRATCAYL